MPSLIFKETTEVRCPKPIRLRSGVPIEKKTRRIYVTDSTDTDKKYPIYSIGPIDLKAGDIVQIVWQAEVTAPSSERWAAEWIGVGRGITRSSKLPSCTSTEFDGSIIGRLTMDNFSADTLHHKAMNGIVFEKISEALDHRFYNFYLYAVDSAAPDYNNPYILLEATYGYLQVLIHRVD